MPITWDEEKNRVYEHGVDHGVLFVADSNGSYSTGVAWNGLSNVTLSPEGAEPTDIYADNIKYLSLLSAESLKLTIEAYSAPIEFGPCDGTTIGNGVSAFQQARKKFCFAFRTNGGSAGDSNEHHKIYIVYGCLASPTERAYETINDSPEANTLSWEVTTTPVMPSTANQTAGYKATSLVCVDQYIQSSAGAWTLNANYTTINTALESGSFTGLELDTILAMITATNAN